jgi:hypothetical protein
MDVTAPMDGFLTIQATVFILHNASTVLLANTVQHVPIPLNIFHHATLATPPLLLGTPAVLDASAIQDYIPTIAANV